MTYEKTTWQDRVVQNANTYTLVNNPDGTITLLPAEGTITQTGTPITSDKLNNLETQYDEALDWAQSVVQMLKITQDNGFANIMITDTTTDILSTLLNKGYGVNTFYVLGGAVNAPPSGYSARGISYFDGDTGGYYGFIIAVDTHGQTWTNYHNGDANGWTGWQQLASTSLEAWNTPSFVNGWTNYGNGYKNCAYRKDNFGRVHLEGLVSGGTQGTAIFNLPSKYRPSKNTGFVLPSASNTISRVEVRSNGDVYVTYFGTTYIFLDGISFDLN